MPQQETPGHSWASLGQSLVGSLLLSSGSRWAQGFVCALQESVSPVLCKFWQLYGGVNGDLLQDMPYPGLLHPEPLPLQQSSADLYLFRRHSNIVLPQSLGPGAHKVLFVPSKSLFPQSCVSFGGPTVGLMVTSTKSIIP